MANYFSYFNYNGQPFILFGKPQLVFDLIFIVIFILLYISRKRIRSSKSEKKFRYSIASILLIQEAVLNIWRIYNHAWSLNASLPLELCSVSVILASIMLFTKNYKLFELVYFWGLGGAINSLITPDLGVFGFPHFRFFQFFISHALIIFAILYMVFVYEYYPTHKSILKVFIITILYGSCLIIINIILNSNYLYLCWKPEAGTILDFMGPWPLYVIIFVLFTFLVCYILYVPILIRNILSSK